MPVPSATVFARRAFSYLINGQAELALRDAMQAQVCIPEWPTAFFLQALALSKLGMETDAQDMLNDGTAFEAKRQNSWRGWILSLLAIYLNFNESLDIIVLWEHCLE